MSCARLPLGMHAKLQRYCPGNLGETAGSVCRKANTMRRRSDSAGFLWSGAIERRRSIGDGDGNRIAVRSGRHIQPRSNLAVDGERLSSPIADSRHPGGAGVAPVSTRIADTGQRIRQRGPTRASHQSGGHGPAARRPLIEADSVRRGVGAGDRDGGCGLR